MVSRCVECLAHSIQDTDRPFHSLALRTINTVHPTLQTIQITRQGQSITALTITRARAQAWARTALIRMARTPVTNITIHPSLTSPNRNISRIRHHPITQQPILQVPTGSLRHIAAKEKGDFRLRSVCSPLKTQRSLLVCLTGRSSSLTTRPISLGISNRFHTSMNHPDRQHRPVIRRACNQSRKRRARARTK